MRNLTIMGHEGVRVRKAGVNEGADDDHGEGAEGSDGVEVVVNMGECVGICEGMANEV